ncbi:MAG: hypothetical protein AB1502_01530, partial [Thermodesulfobacteriota bacterium]
GLKSFPQPGQVMSLPPDPPLYYDGMSINDFYKKYTNDYSVTYIHFFLDKKIICGIFPKSLINHILNSILSQKFLINQVGKYVGSYELK